jgi:hypothetical protein
MQGDLGVPSRRSDLSQSTVRLDETAPMDHALLREHWDLTRKSVGQVSEAFNVSKVAVRQTAQPICGLIRHLSEKILALPLGSGGFAAHRGSCPNDPATWFTVRRSAICN